VSAKACTSGAAFEAGSSKSSFNVSVDQGKILSFVHGRKIRSRTSSSEPVVSYKLFEVWVNFGISKVAVDFGRCATEDVSVSCNDSFSLR
jgi:hypothetical protein